MAPPTMKDLFAQYRKDIPFIPNAWPFRVSLKSIFSTEKSEITDIDEVIKLDRSVLDVCPPGHPDRASSPKPQSMRFYPIGGLTPQK